MSRHLRRLAIRTYRSIRQADLKLGEVTVIIGPSDSGKSNVVRALRDWAFNAAGSDMIAVGANVARVGVAIGPDRKVVWEKRGQHAEVTGPGSSYLTFEAGQEPGRRYEKIGHGVPEEVRALTGSRMLEVGDGFAVRVQFSEQHDPWFLLGNPPWTPAAVTKVVGRVGGIDALVLGNRDLETSRQQHVRGAREARERAQELEGSLAAFEGLARAQELVQHAAGTLARFRESSARLAEAESVLAAFRDKSARMKRAAALLAALGPALEQADELDRRLAAMVEVEAQVQKVVRFDKRVKDAAAQVSAAAGNLEAAEVAWTALLASDELRCPLCGESAHDECRGALGASVAVPQRRGRS